MLTDPARPVFPRLARPLEVQPLRPGLALCWGDEFSGAILAREPTVRAADAVVAFVLGEGAHPGGDRMLLLRAASLGRCEGAGATSAFHVTLALVAEAWRELLADDKTPGAAQLRAFAEEGEGGEGATFPLTPAARFAVESIRRCPFGGACREMALIARSNDLLLEFLTTLAAARVPRPVTLTQSLEEQVRTAAEILAQNLESPPAVAELARRVGLSETTLKRGFHQVFATTIFGYLRTRRMERAHAALQSGEATVLEAAALVGYSNPSNFAAAFRRQFGVNPKTFQMAVRR